MARTSQARSSHPLRSILDSLHEHLRQLERVAGPDLTAARSTPRHIEPAWRRVTQGEPRLAVAIAVGVAIALQMLLPNQSCHPSVVAPAGVGGGVLVGLIAANPTAVQPHLDDFADRQPGIDRTYFARQRLVYGRTRNRVDQRYRG